MLQVQCSAEQVSFLCLTFIRAPSLQQSSLMRQNLMCAVYIRYGVDKAALQIAWLLPYKIIDLLLLKSLRHSL